MSYHALMLENQTLFTKMVFSGLGPHHLSVGQPKILEFLSRQNGSVQKDIAKHCMIEPATVTSLLSKMEKDGLIIRKTLNNNRRTWYVYLTDVGKEKANYVNEVFDEAENCALKGLTVEDKILLLDLLSKVNINLKG
jgi:DNA-binding MarR family transcriptional regulator